MTLYVRVGNRTLTNAEIASLSAKQIEQIKIDAEKANKKRLENIQRSMGINPQAVTLDVTPAAVAARNAAIKVEEARIAAVPPAEPAQVQPEAPVEEAPPAPEGKKEAAKGKKAKAATA